MTEYVVNCTSESGDEYSEIFDTRPTDAELSAWCHDIDGDADKAGPGYDGSYIHIDDIFPVDPLNDLGNTSEQQESLDRLCVQHDEEYLPRQLAYEAIDSERDYQDSLTRNVVNKNGDATFSPITNLAIIEELCARMKSEFYDNPGHPPMDYMRKIAATAVRTMETFGAPTRKTN